MNDGMTRCLGAAAIMALGACTPAPAPGTTASSAPHSAPLDRPSAGSSGAEGAAIPGMGAAQHDGIRLDEGNYFVNVALGSSLTTQSMGRGESYSLTGNPEASFLTFQVLGDERGWLRVRSLSPGPTSCHGYLAGLEHFGLEFWLAKSAVSPMTSGRIELETATGQSLRLGPGVSFVGLEAEGPKSLGSIALPVPAGTEAADIPPFTLDWTAPLWQPAPGNGQLELDGALDQVYCPGSLPGACFPVYGTGEPEQPMLIDLRSPCVEMAIHAEEGELRQRSALEPVAEAPTATPSGDGLVLQAGAGLFWRSGEQAGQMRAAHTVSRASEVPGSGLRRCFQVSAVAAPMGPRAWALEGRRSLGSGDGHPQMTVAVCLEPGDVMGEPATEVAPADG